MCPCFLPINEIWNIMLNKLKYFTITKKRLPEMNIHDKDEQEIRKWMDKQVNEMRLNKFTCAFKYDVNKEKWYEFINEYSEYFTDILYVGRKKPITIIKKLPEEKQLKTIIKKLPEEKQLKTIIKKLPEEKQHIIEVEIEIEDKEISNET